VAGKPFIHAVSAPRLLHTPTRALGALTVRTLADGAAIAARRGPAAVAAFADAARPALASSRTPTTFGTRAARALARRAAGALGPTRAGIAARAPAQTAAAVLALADRRTRTPGRHADASIRRRPQQKNRQKTVHGSSPSQFSGQQAHLKKVACRPSFSPHAVQTLKVRNRELPEGARRSFNDAIGRGDRQGRCGSRHVCGHPTRQPTRRGIQRVLLRPWPQPAAARAGCGPASIGRGLIACRRRSLFPAAPPFRSSHDLGGATAVVRSRGATTEGPRRNQAGEHDGSGRHERRANVQRGTHDFACFSWQKSPALMIRPRATGSRAVGPRWPGPGWVE